MPHEEITVKCTDCGTVYCVICHPNGCPGCQGVHIGTPIPDYR